MSIRNVALVAGVSYVIIFFAAIFANFLVLESILSKPLETVQNSHQMVRFGIMAFLVTALFDVVVAWALQLIYKSHVYTILSTLLRIMHAAIMAIAVYALVAALSLDTADGILKEVNNFNNIWLIGLFFFGAHLILLGQIVKTPKFINIFLIIAGIMYIVDTAAHFLMADYADYQSIFLALVAIPSIFGEMSFSVWLLVKGGKETV